ncbi:hypothetical protein RND71_037393 [Anisodus tanguticus]|uniref:RNase H type-1 domain-containing protein n=1 Tax=Anisodus tanguticus TaxID=243964 RepID=A0AAE1R3W5_9SOLA|nr:hypothetical protein RND71_037393 [Anisodus tanguticus]
MGSVKINVAGIGGIIRDNNSNFIQAFSKPVHCGNNNQTEAIAARFTFQWSLAEGFDNVTVEMDSLIIINMLNNNSSDNLNLKRVI